MARISEHYRLFRTQPSLDFVDVDMSKDLKVFVDPQAIKLVPTEWGHECVALIQNFFGTIMDAIRNKEHELARDLLSALREPNETHLGLSKGRSRGRGMGNELAERMWKALRSSEAVTSGLLTDLEDTVLLVDGIATDIISDITTNIIRQPLINYTQMACRWYNIPLQDDVESGPMWDPTSRTWFNELVKLPMGETGKLLLVPKSIVRIHLAYRADEYYQHYILEHLRRVELDANSALVHTLKKGGKRVTKKSLTAKYGRGKHVNRAITRADPAILSRYKKSKETNVSPAIEHADLAIEEQTPGPDWDTLISDVIALPAGRPNANNYERTVEALLTALFYPALSQPVPQQVIHDGRKRIDITYSNIATIGFFAWIAQHYPVSNVFVECKNYNADPANPELDQLCGRFSPRRGRVGILVCRSLADRQLFAKRCRDAANDDRGFVIALDDNDLQEMVRARQEAETIKVQLAFPLLRARFDALIM